VRPRTVFLGSGAFALPALARLAQSDAIDLAAVVSVPARPSGRRGELRPTPVAEWATGRGMLVLEPASLRDVVATAPLRELEPALVVLADYGRLVPPWLLELPRHGALNLHPSLLPRHRGAAPVPAAILAGDPVTGVTLMHMDEGLDSGPIIAQVELPLDGTEVAPALEARLAELAAGLLTASLPGWLDGRLTARPQAAEGATLTRPLRREDGRLDPARPARELERQVRAFQPWPGSWTEWQGDRLVVWRASLVPRGPVDAAVGVSRLDGSLLLTTSDGGLRLEEVQPAGRRRMSAAEFLRGRRS
jgi:methionyl-tRNA formyltransferase